MLFLKQNIYSKEGESVVTNESMSLMDKLEILTDAAKYDVACTSSGVNRKGQEGMTGNAVSRGICHCFAGDGRCISLLKILFTNECIYDCKYCLNRSSNDVVRASFTPEEVANLTIEFYKRNYIEGLFLSSGIIKNPDYTMEQIITAISLLRNQYHFNGYIHVKAIPGAHPSLVEELGHLADRMSINLELPTTEGLKQLAPNKHRKNILTPMRQIQNGIKENKLLLQEQKSWKKRSSILLPEQKLTQGSGSYLEDNSSYGMGHGHTSANDILQVKEETEVYVPSRTKEVKSFVPAGQSTQMIIGATPETDFQLIQVAESLYDKFDLKRVFYSAFINTTFDSSLPVLPGGPPLLREHRLYQADWLLRFYGFEASELLSEDRPNFNTFLDPKCNWAVNHLGEFPVEINKASYKVLLRVPGIGTKSAQKIVATRKHTVLDFSDLKKLGISLKRAQYFITCKGKMMYPFKIQEDYIVEHLLDCKERLPEGIGGSGLYEQLSLFDDMNFVHANHQKSNYN